MAADVVVIGASTGIGRELAKAYVERGARVAIGGRDEERAKTVAAELGGETTAFSVDLADPHSIGERLRELGNVDRLVVTPILRDNNTVRDYDIDGALHLASMKLVGYTEVVHQLADRLSDDASILLFGGRAKDRPDPGSTTVTTVNGAISTLIVTLAIELAPIRVNAIHPGICGDSPAWADKPDAVARVVERTPTGRMVRMADVVDAAIFLLENPSMNGQNIAVDGGWLLL
jgi:NAD(P)-dependent dehydrogenase (short-subunit alcohol dehydrogenase family)